MTIPCATSAAHPMCGSVRVQCLDVGGLPFVTVYRPAGTTEWGPGAPSCSGQEPPGPPDDPQAQVQVVPPTPSLAQIQSAFRELPFCMPEPSMQPVGGTTLVNLPTYYAASWPDAGDCLTPGEVSAPVQLLSWSVEFEVAAQDYRYVYGDGKDSGWTSSTGGAYPDGDVTHTYADTGRVQVRVDARLTGRFRANGGAWQDLDATADLQDEPAVALRVVEAKPRLTAEG